MRLATSDRPHRICSSGTNCQPSFYKDILERLRKRVIRVRPNIADKWMLHHYKTHYPLSHTISELERHSCGSSALLFLTSAPVKFSFFPKLKNSLKGRHFGTSENIQKSVTNMLNTIPIEDYQRCYQKWKQRLHQCEAAQGNYFEGEYIDRNKKCW